MKNKIMKIIFYTYIFLILATGVLFKRFQDNIPLGIIFHILSVLGGLGMMFLALYSIKKVNKDKEQEKYFKILQYFSNILILIIGGQLVVTSFNVLRILIS